MTPAEIMAVAAPFLLTGMLLALGEMGRRGALLRLERQAWAEERARADELLGNLRHDLHCATAREARQASTIAHQAETIDQLSLSVLGLHGQLISTMIRAGEALTEAELAHPLPQHLPFDAGDHVVRDELKSGKAG